MFFTSWEVFSQFKYLSEPKIGLVIFHSALWVINIRKNRERDLPVKYVFWSKIEYSYRNALPSWAISKQVAIWRILK